MHIKHIIIFNHEAHVKHNYRSYMYSHWSCFYKLLKVFFELKRLNIIAMNVTNNIKSAVLWVIMWCVNIRQSNLLAARFCQLAKLAIIRTIGIYYTFTNLISINPISNNIWFIIVAMKVLMPIYLCHLWIKLLFRLGCNFWPPFAMIDNTCMGNYRDSQFCMMDFLAIYQF